MFKIGGFTFLIIDHQNYCGMDSQLGPVIISVLKEKKNWRIIAWLERVRCQQETQK
jgi:hypothetical protein